MSRRALPQTLAGLTATAALVLSPSLACSAPAADDEASAGSPTSTTSTGATDASSTAAASPAPSRAAKIPTFKVTRMVKGYSHVWDVASVGSEGWIFTERESAKVRIVKGKAVHNVAFPSSSVWVSGETGLMGIAVDPAFTTNRRFYTCQGGFTKNGHDVRVMAWKLSANGRKALSRGKLLGGLPTSSGRHGGCRLLIERDTGALFVGTGDAAIGTNPENLKSLGGKILRLDRMTGKPLPDNPFVNANNRNKRYVYNYGHRNVQGLAQRADGSLWSAEHGPDRDDEINLVLRGADYGWNPVPGYNESVPMTDQSLPGPQTEAQWSTGFPTLATSGITFVTGPEWGSLRGTLAVAALKASRVVFLRFDADGTFVKARTPAALRQYGRLRSLTLAPNGDLLATQDNGSNDGILRISPTAP